MKVSRLFEIIRHPKQIPGILRWRWRHHTQPIRAFCGKQYREIYRCFYQLPTVPLAGLVPSQIRFSDLIMDHMCMPPHDANHDDATPVLSVIRHLNPKVVLELGTAYGNLTANICKLSDAHVFTVNALPEHITGEIFTFALDKEEIGCVYRKYGYQNRVTQIYANTLELDLIKYFTRPCVDLAVLDACHDTSYVMNDFIKLLPVLNNGAVAFFHDTHPSMKEHLAGSYFACMKLRRMGFDICHIENTWWGIWKNKIAGTSAAISPASLHASRVSLKS